MAENPKSTVKKVDTQRTKFHFPFFLFTKSITRRSFERTPKAIIVFGTQRSPSQRSSSHILYIVCRDLYPIKVPVHRTLLYHHREQRNKENDDCCCERSSQKTTTTPTAAAAASATAAATASPVARFIKTDAVYHGEKTPQCVY